jgi:hypothetical protein
MDVIELKENIKTYLNKINEIKRLFIDSNKEFDVNERVRILPINGYYNRIAEVKEIICNNEGKIIYVLNKVTSDGITVDKEYKLNKNEKIVKLV